MPPISQDPTENSPPADLPDRRLIVLRPPDLAAAADLLATAFRDEPAGRALLPDADARRRLKTAAARVRLPYAARTAAAHGVFLDGTLAGVAVWQPPGVGVAGPGAIWPLARALFADRRALLASLRANASALWRDRAHLSRFFRQRQAAARRAGEGAAWYLALLATDPAHRGRGVARQLLEHVLDRCDADGLPAWTEATNEDNVEVYARFGFAVVERIEGGGALPHMWVLRREPRN